MDTSLTSPTDRQPAKRVHFRPTTPSQRQCLFDVAERTGHVSEGARQAHVGRGVYYYWHPRLEAEGPEALLHPRSSAPHRTRIPPVSEVLRQEVREYAAAHPKAGCRTIANDLGKAHNWQKVISHSKVREILLEARATTPSAPVSEAPSAPAAAFPAQAVHAPQPNQTFNIDLCVVPQTHDGQTMASVSLSLAAAGVLPAEPVSPTPRPECPGQVFAEADQPYEEQMQAYAAKRAAKRATQSQRKHRRRQKQAERTEINARSDEVRLARRRQRAQRREEDVRWLAQRQAHREAEQSRHGLSKQERRERRAEPQAEPAGWQAAKAERHAQLQQRRAEDTAWRQERLTIREQLARLMAAAPLVTTWLAILVVVDNASRRCLELPLFTAGVHVTGEMIVAALRAVCPPELQFLISDNGAQFIGQAFAAFVRDYELIHVRIAPQRPCTNGIAERFVRTLKEWLETRTWNSPDELEALLAEFRAYYNDRPHQGAELVGLSPNEFAHRLQCSTG